MSASLDVILGRAISRVRQIRPMSQKELAERAGISQAAVSYVESGRKSTSLDTLRNMASALGMPVSGLMLLVEEASDLENEALFRRAREVLKKEEGWISFEEAEKMLDLEGKKGAA